MSRLSRILVLATAAAAVGLMAIVGGSNRVAGQNSPRAEDGAEPAKREQSASGDEAAERETAVEPAPAGSEPGRSKASGGAEPWDGAAPAVRRRDANRQIEQSLPKRVSFNFKEERLRDVLAELARAGSFPLWVDDKALVDIGVSADDTLTMDLEGVTVEQAFNRALHGRGLTWLVHSEVLRVTTVEEAELALVTKIYGASHLLLPDRTSAGILPPLSPGSPLPNSFLHGPRRRRCVPGLRRCLPPGSLCCLRPCCSSAPRRLRSSVSTRACSTPLRRPAVRRPAVRSSAA